MSLTDEAFVQAVVDKLAQHGDLITLLHAEEGGPSVAVVVPVDIWHAIADLIPPSTQATAIYMHHTHIEPEA